MFDIDGQKALVMGFLWINFDKSISIIHIGLQDWKNQPKLKVLGRHTWEKDGLVLLH